MKNIKKKFLIIKIMNLTNNAVLNKLHILKTTDDLTIGNNTLTELLND